MSSRKVSSVPPQGAAELAGTAAVSAASLFQSGAAVVPLSRLHRRTRAAVTGDRGARQPLRSRAGRARGGHAVRQTVRSVVVEVQPKSARVLRELILGLRDHQERTTPRYDRLTTKAPALHFMSMTVFEDAHYDPIFVIEVNFDGASGPFWAQLEAAIGPEVRGMLRCCEPPRDSTATLFEAVIAVGSRRPLAPFLEAHAVRPAIHHVGNRGLPRERIVRQAELFFAAQEQLGDGREFQGLDAVAVHQSLRTTLLPRFPWLEGKPPARIPPSERAADALRLTAFAGLLLLGLSFPGLVLALLVPAWAVLALAALAALASGGVLWLQDRPKEKSGPPALPGFGILAAVIAVVAVYLGALSVAASVLLALLGGLAFDAAFWICVTFFGLALAGAPATVLALLLWLRRLERRDPAQDAPPVDEEARRAMARREDQGVQNHMGSVVLVKPGVLRAVLIRAGLWGLGLVLRLTATDGHLGRMRTIHFAHWALVSNGSRLMFFSNFDGSWESYLDDFIEKAHGGLTLAWGSGVGFPPARYLVLGGASQGRQFKRWARHSMAESLFWFSAYENLTVDQIERHASVADGLCRPSLTGGEAATWTKHL